MHLKRIRLILAATIAFACIAAFADDVQWSGTISGQGTDIGQLLFDQWAFSYAQVNPRTAISFVGATSGNVGSAAAVSAVTAGTLDFANSEQPLQPVQRNLAGQDIIQFPLAGISMVFTYNLPYGGMMDRNNQSAQLILDGYTAQQIWIKNLTNWRDPRLLAIQTPEVRALLPNTNITLVVRSDSCSANNFIQGSLRNFSTTTWPYGSASQTWSTAYRNDVRVLSVAENTGAAALVSYTKNSLGYVALTASTKNVRYAAMVNVNGDLVRTANLTAALAHPYAIQTFHPSTKYISTALLNSRAPNAWPMGGYTFAIMRMQNTTLACERRREMLLFFNWILSSQFEQKRMSVYGFQSLGDPILQNVLADLRSTPLCKPNTTSPIAWAEAVQHEPATNFQAVLGANIAMLILTVILFAVYISDNFKGVAASARVFQVVLFTGGILNYVSIFYFYQIPKDDSVCQARLWLSAMGFTLIFSSLACRGYQILAVSQLSKKVTTRVPHMVIIGLGNTLLAGVQIIILLAWNQSDPFKSQLANIDEFRRTSEYICRSDNATVWWSVEIAFAVALLCFCLFVAYLTWDLKHMVQESKWMSISIYNAVVVLGISLALHMSSVNSDDSVFWVTGTVLFLLNTSIMLAMFGPKVYNRIRSIRDPENASSSASHSDGVSHMNTTVTKANASQLSTTRGTSSKMGTRTTSGAASPNNKSRGLKTTPRLDIKTETPTVPEGQEEPMPAENPAWASPMPSAAISTPVVLPNHPEPLFASHPGSPLEVETHV